MAGAFFSGGCTGGREHLSNWAGNLEYSTDRVRYPGDTDAVREVVKSATKLRALGSRHSFNTIADSNDALVSSDKLNKIISLDRAQHSVTVEGGIRYGELVEYLHKNGYALHNLASLPHISVAGSIATATHGSGVRNGNLATSVSAIEFIDGGGNVVQLSRKDGDVFHGAVVGLGALGFVTKVTLDLQPAFEMKQIVYRNMPMDELKDHFMTIMSAGYSVSLFTDWSNRNINQVWIKYRDDDNKPAAPEKEFFGGRLAEENVHPVEGQPAESCTDQLNVAGAWYDRLPHFKMGFTPSAGVELQSEYFVPMEKGYEAIMSVETLHEEITPHLFISEIRTIDGDNLWMSPCYKKPCVAIHTTWKQDWPTVHRLLPLMEEKLAPFEARPHWGKLFTISPPILKKRIERLPDFVELSRKYDPSRKFVNQFLSENVFSV